MISLYTMLFADNRFGDEDSILFDWNPMFWGMGPEKFGYTRKSLQQAILGEMERENWIGVCCEPNLVFIVCNQFPLLAMRYNDVTDGTHIFDEVLPKYQTAWAKKSGFVGNNGLFKQFYATGQNQTLESSNIAHTAWAMAFMSWNMEFVKSLYPQTGHGYLQRKGDRLNLNSETLANKIRELHRTEGADPEASATVERARELVAGAPPSSMPYFSPAFGYIAQWLSEIESGEDLAALLRHADAYLRPNWEKGGLYYERNEQGWDADGNYTYGEAYTGNAGIGYARLNVKEGQRKMWERPWTQDDVNARPWVDGVALESGVDCLRGVWDEEERVMLVSLSTWDAHKQSVCISVNALPHTTWGVYVDGQLVQISDVSGKSRIVTIDLDVSGEIVDVVVLEVGKH